MREETRKKYELVIDGYLSNMTMAAAYMEVYPNCSLSTARIEKKGIGQGFWTIAKGSIDSKGGGLA